MYGAGTLRPGQTKALSLRDTIVPKDKVLQCDIVPEAQIYEYRSQD